MTITTPAQMREAAARCCEAEADKCDDAAKWGGSKRYVSDCKAAAYAMLDRAAAIRALPVAEPAPVAVRVKPLVWVFHDKCQHYSSVHISGGWTISHLGGGPFVLHNRDFNDGIDRAFPTIEAAKAAAQARHDARILSQIDAIPAAQVRAAALEEAAKLPPYDCDGDPAGSFDHHVFVKRDAIRAMIEKETT